MFRRTTTRSTKVSTRAGQDARPILRAKRLTLRPSPRRNGEGLESYQDARPETASALEWACPEAAPTEQLSGPHPSASTPWLSNRDTKRLEIELRD